MAAVGKSSEMSWFTFEQNMTSCSYLQIMKLKMAAELPANVALPISK